MKKNLKHFNLEAALNGAAVVTRTGYKVAEIRRSEEHHFYGKYDMPVKFRMAEFSWWCCATIEGRSIGNSDMDLFML